MCVSLNFGDCMGHVISQREAALEKQKHHTWWAIMSTIRRHSA